MYSLTPAEILRNILKMKNLYVTQKQLNAIAYKNHKYL
jgi:hypothetical protein